MKKFWHSGTQQAAVARGEEGIETASFTLNSLQSDGRVNLAFENEQGRRPAHHHLEAIEEEESDLSFNSNPGTAAETVAGFKFSPKDDRLDQAGKAADHVDTDKFDDELEDYNIMDAPSSKMSRARLLPYLLDSLQHVEEVCTDPDCPYNRWLYGEEEFPSEEHLSEWEEAVNQQSLSSQSISCNIPTSLESTRIPQNNSTLTNSDTSKQSSGPPPYTSGSYRSTYPIITLPKSARKQRNTKSGLTDVKLPLPDANSVSGCSCETSSISSCSTCIHEPEDPTAPHAFVVQDGPRSGSEEATFAFLGVISAVAPRSPLCSSAWSGSWRSYSTCTTTPTP